MRRPRRVKWWLGVLAGILGLIGACWGTAMMRSAPPPSATYLVVDKRSLTLTVYDGRTVLVRFPVAVGKNPGPKRREGDWRTPEGRFSVTDVDSPPKDAVLWLSYPNEEAAKWGVEHRVITRKEHDEILAALKRRAIPLQWTALGGGIAIHADQLKTGRWTAGCVVLKNADMFALVRLVRPGTPVIIRGDGG